MKKRYCSILLSIFLGLHLSSLDISAQSCTQLSLPENAIACLCTQDNQAFIDLDFSPDGQTLASVVVRKIVLWDIENKTAKLTINDVNPRIDLWANHFRLEGMRIVSLTTIGEVTDRILGFNHVDRLIERQELAVLGQYPSSVALMLISK